MAQKSGFFNALLQSGEYDRVYNANDYSDNLAVVIGNGVLRSINDDLKVTANGLYVSVGVGRAWINGHYYLNDTVYNFSPITAPAGGSRYDRVMLRLDNSLTNRNISLLYVEGEVSNDPVKPAPVRTGDIYDLVLADIYVDASAEGVEVTDTRSDMDICGWVYSVTGNGAFFTTLDNDFNEWFQGAKDTLSSVTLFKRYTWRETLETATDTVLFDIVQYDPETCFIEVYVNGIFDNRHEIEDNTIYFEGTLIAGTVVTVNCYKSIDGEGIMTVADEITELQNSVAQMDAMSQKTYKCTGNNDNIALSEIANAIVDGYYDVDEVSQAAKTFLSGLGGNSWLEDLSSDEVVTIEVSGNLSASTPFAGEGTAENPYVWFHMGESDEQRKVVFDFSKSEKAYVLFSKSSNYIFYGSAVNIKNLNIAVVDSSQGAFTQTNVKFIECNGNKLNAVNVENCKIYINSETAALIANHGIFTNCDCEVVAGNSTGYCFKPKSDTFIRLNGGTYRAYGLTSTGISSAIIHTSASETDAVCMAFGIHAPTINRTNYTQGFLSVANAGFTQINGVVTRLTSSGSYNTITGLINRSKN